MYYLVELIIAIIISYFFIRNKKPKLKFLFLGYFFFFISLILQIPFKYLKLKIIDYFPINFEFSIIFLSILIIIISELTKYFSLKKFLKTKSYKNAILFGIGWVSLESINYFSILFYSFVFLLIPIKFSYIQFLPQQISILNFLFFFIINLSITVLVIISIIKKNFHYLIFAISYAIIILLLIQNLIGLNKYIFMFIIFIYSIYIIFKYNKLK